MLSFTVSDKQPEERLFSIKKCIITLNDSQLNIGFEWIQHVEKKLD